MKCIASVVCSVAMNIDLSCIHAFSIFDILPTIYRRPSFGEMSATMDKLDSLRARVDSLFDAADNLSQLDVPLDSFDGNIPSGSDNECHIVSEKAFVRSHAGRPTRCA